MGSRKLIAAALSAVLFGAVAVPSARAADFEGVVVAKNNGGARRSPPAP